MLLQYVPGGGEKIMRDKAFTVLKKEYHVELAMIVKGKVATSVARRDEVARNEAADGRVALWKKCEPVAKSVQDHRVLSMALAVAV
eukprot:13703463-Heterocapsa_arctica.AAC.1